MARDDDFEDHDNPYAAPETYDFEEDMSEGNTGTAEYATFWARFAAYFVDTILMAISQFVILFGFVAATGSEESVMVAQIFNFILQWIYFAGFTSSSYMATPGKMAVGIKVTALNGNRIGFGNATGRYFGKIISSLILLIGFIMQPFTEKKQALHDIMAGTLVVKK